MTLSVAGITGSALVRVLGVIYGGDVFLKVLVSLANAIAITSKTARKDFGVKRKAGDLFVIDAELKILQYRIPKPRAKTNLKTRRSRL
ncbi:MAG: hypothetical protein AAGG02_05650 [Cyanobacteria bacterium P01_H01_bin.15]